MPAKSRELGAEIIDFLQGDPLLARMRLEAEDVLRREPELGGFIHAAVLAQETVFGVVAHRVAQRLDRPEAPYAAIRQACPGVIINLTTGVIGKDITGPLACIRRVRPEIAACNAGSLNYLKIKDDGNWAWPPMLFDNPVDKVKAMLDVMREVGTHPEFECFDVGIVRSVGMYRRNGMTDHLEYNFVMGVASGMPVDADLLKLLVKYREPGAVWQHGILIRRPVAYLG